MSLSRSIILILFSTQLFSNNTWYLDSYWEYMSGESK